MPFVQLLFILLLSTFSCTSSPTPSSTKPIVLVSVPPYAFFVKTLAEDSVQVETLVPVGANPHLYEASPKEVQQHQKASLWIYLGEPFDKRVLTFFEQTGKPIQVLRITEGLDLLSSCEEDHCLHGEGEDLHVWLSPHLDKAQAEKIAAALGELLPEQQGLIQKRLHTLLRELDALDRQISKELAPYAGKAILVSHPAFGYFCRDYDLVQLSIETEGKEPRPQEMQHLLEEVKQYQVQSVILEPQYSNKGAERIAEELHLKTHTLDPYAENVVENLKKIAEEITQ